MQYSVVFAQNSVRQSSNISEISLSLSSIFVLLIVDL